MPAARALFAAIAAAGLALAPCARADEPPAADRALAEALFREGRHLMESGKVAEACAKLAESQRIDPGLGTLLNLATCHALEGKTATAWAELADARAQALRAGREKNAAFARDQMTKLEARLSRVVIAAERPADGFEVELDHQALGPGVLASPLPVDPGRHTLRASAPGRAPWTATLDVPNGPSTQTVSVPELAREAPSPARPAAADHETSPARRDEPPPSRAPSPLAWAFGGVALVGAGVGTYFGVRAFTKNADATNACPGNACSAAGMELDTQARTAATISTVAVAVSAAAAVAAVYFFVARPTRAASARLGVGPGGVALRGAW